MLQFSALPFELQLDRVAPTAGGNMQTKFTSVLSDNERWRKRARPMRKRPRRKSLFHVIVSAGCDAQRRQGCSQCLVRRIVPMTPCVDVGEFDPEALGSALQCFPGRFQPTV